MERMVERSANRGVFAGAAKLVMGLLAVWAVAVMFSDDADAQVNVQADSDGYVPVYYSCWAGSEVGLYNWYYDGYTTSGSITINQCLLDSLWALARPTTRPS